MYSRSFAVLSIACSVTLDESTPSLVIQVSPNPTPAEIIVITVKTRSGHFQVSVGDGQGRTSLFFFFSNEGVVLGTLFDIIMPKNEVLSHYHAIIMVFQDNIADLRNSVIWGGKTHC